MACASTSGCSAVRRAAADIVVTTGPGDLGGALHTFTSQKSAAKMQKAARALSVLGGLAIALAEDADVDGSFEDGSGSGEPGSGEPSSGVYPSPPPPVDARP